jgi:hypothetical protein
MSTQTAISLDDMEVVALRKLLYLEVDDSEEAAQTSPIEAVAKLIDRVEDLEEENQRLRSELEDAKGDAELALAVAGETKDRARADGGPTKVKRAELLSRNEVVRQAIDTTGKGGSVTAGDVVDMARPARLSRQQPRESLRGDSARA